MRRAEERLTLVSLLSPEECAEKLAAALDLEIVPFGLLATILGNKPALGWVKGGSFSIRRRIAYANSFQTYLRGKLVPGDGFTLIEGVFGAHVFVRVFMVIWFAFLGTIGGGVLLLALSRPGAGLWIVPLVVLIMLAFAAALMRFGKYLAREEADFLVEFLVNTLHATPLERESNQKRQHLIHEDRNWTTNQESG